MSVTLSSLPGKFKCSLLNGFCPDGITPNSGLTGLNNIYIYIFLRRNIYKKLLQQMLSLPCCENIQKKDHRWLVLLAHILQTLFHKSSLSSITSDRSSSRHPVSIENCCRYDLLNRPTLTHPCEDVHWRKPLMILFLILQQCPTGFVNLIWLVLEIGSRWPYNCFVRCYFQDLFSIDRKILGQKRNKNSTSISVEPKIINWFIYQKKTAIQGRQLLKLSNFM